MVAWCMAEVDRFFMTTTMYLFHEGRKFMLNYYLSDPSGSFIEGAMSLPRYCHVQSLSFGLPFLQHSSLVSLTILSLCMTTYI